LNSRRQRVRETLCGYTIPRILTTNNHALGLIGQLLDKMVPGRAVTKTVEPKQPDYVVLETSNPYDAII
jgi:hypothetical protein